MGSIGSLKAKKAEKNKSMFKSIRNNRGFSLIELMAIMIVVGALSAIAISSASSIINKSKKEKVSQNMKNVTMAAKMYVQNNRDLLPKNIGEEKIIKLSVLKDSNYLKETVTNEAGESCMEESLVRVYKLSSSEYEYTPYLYCGEDKAPAKIEVAKPEISDFEFSKSTNVNEATFSFKIKGDSTGDGEIYSYTYSILVKNNNEDFTEVYSSGSVSGNNKKEIEFSSKPLVEYIDITGFSVVKIRVTAINRAGGSISVDSVNQGSGAVSFNDTVPPTCVPGGSIGEAENDNDWINKANIDSEQYPRIISVKCADGAGSGCKRDLFSDSWPDQENYVFGTKFADIKIEDNAVMASDGKIKEPNSALCPVKVNADVKSPKIEVTVVNPVNGKAKETKTLSVSEDGKKVPDKLYPKGTITADSYVNQKGDDSIKWLNAEHYPQGIKFNIKITDNIYLYKYTWETNPAYIRGGSSDEQITANVSKNNPDVGEHGEVILVPNINTYENSKTGLLEHNFSITLSAEGMRYGVLRVYDKAGNYSELHIYANIDRTAPAIPNTLYQKAQTKKAYQGNADWTSQNLVRSAWSTEHVFAYIKDQQEDHESNNTELSGWKEFKYIYSQQTGISRNGLTVSGYTFKDSAETVCTDKDGATKVGYVMRDEGTHTIKFRSCDKAENCSEYNNDKTHNPYPYVKIDTIAPTCDKVELVHPNGNPLCVDDDPSGGYCSGSTAEAKSKGWLGWKDSVSSMNTISSEKKTAIVYAVCKDSDTKFASLCDGINNYSFGLPSEGKTTATYSVPTDTAVKTLYNKEIAVFPKVMQPYKHYQEDMDVTNAGATGVGNPGKVVDIAGNVTDCTKMYTVRIDYTRPSCKVTMTKSNNNGSTWQSYDGDKDANNGWLGVGWKIKYATEAVDNTKNSASSGSWNKYSDYSTIYEKEIHSVKRATTNRSNGHAFVTPLYVYDKAGNRSQNPCEYKTVKLDFTGPSCEVTAKVTGSSNNTYWKYSGEGGNFGSYKPNDWLNIGYGVEVGKKCIDDKITSNEDYGANTKVGSGCDGKIYSYNTLAPNNLGNSTDTYNRGAESGSRNSRTDAKSGTVTDIVGNPQSCQVIQVRYDNEMPTCNVTRSKTHYQLHSTGSSEWNNRADGVTVSSTCDDKNGSGCMKNGNTLTSCNTRDDENGVASNPTESCLQASNKSHFYTVKKDNIRTITNGGSVAPGVSGYVVDGVGNTQKNGLSKCSATQSVKIDDVKPTCINEKRNTAYVYGNWNDGKGVTITSGCSDIGSQCMLTSCNQTTDDTSCSNCQKASTKSCTFRGAGKTKKWATGTAGAYSTTSGGWVEDQVGNKSEDCKHTFTVWIDDVKPKCENYVATPGSMPTDDIRYWTQSSRNIKVDCNDPTSPGDSASGCKVSSDSRNYTTTTPTGSLDFYDYVNNKTTCNYRVNVDKTAPTATFDGIQYNNKSDLPNNSWVLYELGERIMLKAIIRDTDSGILRYCWSTSSSSCSSPWIQVGSDSSRVTSKTVESSYYDSNQTVYLIVEDRVGLRGSSSFRIDRFGVKRSFDTGTNVAVNLSKNASPSSGYYYSYSGGYNGIISGVSNNKRALTCTAQYYSGSNGSITNASSSASGYFIGSVSCSASGSTTSSTGSVNINVNVTGGSSWTESYKDTKSENSNSESSVPDPTRCKTCQDGWKLNSREQCEGYYGSSYTLRGKDHPSKIICDDDTYEWIEGTAQTECWEDGTHSAYGHLYSRVGQRVYDCTEDSYLHRSCTSDLSITRHCYTTCVFTGTGSGCSVQRNKCNSHTGGTKLSSDEGTCYYCDQINEPHTAETLSSNGYTCSYEYYPTRQKYSYKITGYYIAAA